MSSFIYLGYYPLTSFSDRRGLISHTTFPSCSYHHNTVITIFSFFVRSLLFVCVMYNLFESMKINVSVNFFLIASLHSVLLYLPKGKNNVSLFRLFKIAHFHSVLSHFFSSLKKKKMILFCDRDSFSAFAITRLFSSV